MIKTFKPSYQKQEVLVTHFDFTFRLARPFKFLATPTLYQFHSPLGFKV